MKETKTEFIIVRVRPSEKKELIKKSQNKLSPYIRKELGLDK